MYGVRSTLFYIGYSLSALIYAPIVLIFGWMLPFEQRAWFINRWSWFVLIWLRMTCHIKVELECDFPIDSMPRCIVVSNHQSTWEALYLQLIFKPAVTVIKKDLLRVPFFGWGLALLEPISIDRKKLRTAGKQFLDQGTLSLEKNRWLVLFPEGTRVAVGHTTPLNLGGFRLATATGTAILPVCHNAGYFWPAHRFLKYPGTIKCKVGALIKPELTPRDAASFYEAWVKENTK